MANVTSVKTSELIRFNFNLALLILELKRMLSHLSLLNETSLQIGEN